MKAIVFPDNTIAHTCLHAIGATPDGVIVDPDMPYSIRQTIATDGRVATCHSWSIVDDEWLQEYLSEEPEVESLESLPIGWSTGE